MCNFKPRKKLTNEVILFFAGGSNHHGPPKDLRYRPLNEIANSKDNVRRVASYTPSSLPQRWVVFFLFLLINGMT